MAYTESKDRSSWASKGTSFPNSICRLNGYDDNAVTYIPVVIIGAGESGIAMGCRLKEKLGFDQFRIFDRQGGTGGTWWINRYPGVACDVPAIFYSFSFSPNYRWTTFHPPGPEIVKYLNDVCAKYGITDKIQCNTDVEGCRWIEEDQIWEVTLIHMVPNTGDLSEKDRRAKIESEGREAVYMKKEIIRAKVVVSAVGGLVEPKAWPSDIPGTETFEGEIFHSARWRYDVDMKDKNVVVVGTGCSAAQFVPCLPKEPYNAKSVVQLMRSPPWVMPRPIPPTGTKKWERNAPKILPKFPILAQMLRTIMFFGGEYDFYSIFGDSDFNVRQRKKTEKALLKHLHKTVPQKYHSILTPDYSVGCKRRIFDATWFPGLNDSRIELTTQPIKSVQPHSVTLGPGQAYAGPDGANPPAATDAREIPADVIVLANGFDTTKWLHPLEVTGRGGIDLVAEMDARGGPQAYLGTAMDAFPNFFMIFGPNTATGHSSVILASENMVEHALPFIAKLLNGDATTIEVKRSAEERFTADIQKALSRSVFNSGGCHNWYVNDKTGWNSTVYPYSQIDFTLRCMFPRWADWDIAYTRKGLLKLRLAQARNVALTALMVVGLYRARKAGITISEAVRGVVSGRYLFTLGSFLRERALAFLTR